MDGWWFLLRLKICTGIWLTDAPCNVMVLLVIVMMTREWCGVAWQHAVIW